MERHYNFSDSIIDHADRVLRTLAGHAKTTGRKNPSKGVEESDLTADDNELAARLMRINHAGEVAAQALYQGQSITARNKQVQEKLVQAAEEENDHLAWCRQRINELESHTSHLDPVWYAGSLAIGATAGLAGDKWSLGFLAETERQVVKHIESHLKQIPMSDLRTRAILEQMKTDEQQHATTAIEQGAEELPAPVKHGMKLVSKIMTKASFWV